MVTHKVKPYATREPRGSTREKCFLLWVRRGVIFLQSAMGDFLQKEGGIADFPEAGRDAMEATEDFSSMSGQFLLSPPCHT